MYLTAAQVELTQIDTDDLDAVIDAPASHFPTGTTRRFGCGKGNDRHRYSAISLVDNLAPTAKKKLNAAVI